MSFTFLDSEIIHDSAPVRELLGWEWGSRLASVGMERLEFVGAVPRHELDTFLAEVFRRLDASSRDGAEWEPQAIDSIKFGTIGVRGDDGIQLGEETFIGHAPFTLHEESEALVHIYDSVAAGKRLPMAEAEAVIASLALVMHSDGEILLPLLQLSEHDQYTTTHSINVSVLAMALAEFRGIGPRDARTIGEAALMHDLGMVRVPKSILDAPDPPTEREWELIRRHPVDGARIILASEPQADLAAVVAYEHHLLWNGAGYPHLHYQREIHHATSLVQVCDRYDSLRTQRPFRDVWSPERAVMYVEERAGTEFDADVARSFVTMIRQWDQRVAPVSRHDAIARHAIA